MSEVDIPYGSTSKKIKKALRTDHVSDKDIEGLTFFTDIKKQLSEQKFYQLVNEAHLQHFKKFSNVFNYGDFGRKFYVIQKGSVYVIAPINEEENYQENIASLESKYLKEEADRESFRLMMVEMGPTMRIVAVLGPDTTFGEVALRSSVPRTATIVCQEDCTLIAIHVDIYNSIVDKYHAAIYEDDIEFLHSFPFLKGWTKAQITNLLRNIKRMQCTCNQIIYSIGDSSDKIYFVKEGEFEILTRPKEEPSTQVKDNSEVHLQRRVSRKEVELQRAAVLTPGCSFGIEEIASKTQKRSNKVICVSSTALLYSVDKSAFFNAMQDKWLANDLRAESQTKLDSRLLRFEEKQHIQNILGFNNTNSTQSEASSPIVNQLLNSQNSTPTAIETGNITHPHYKSNNIGIFRESTDVLRSSDIQKQQSLDFTHYILNTNTTSSSHTRIPEIQPRNNQQQLSSSDNRFYQQSHPQQQQNSITNLQDDTILGDNSRGDRTNRKTLTKKWSAMLVPENEPLKSSGLLRRRQSENLPSVVTPLSFVNKKPNNLGKINITNPSTPIMNNNYTQQQSSNTKLIGMCEPPNLDVQSGGNSARRFIVSPPLSPTSSKSGTNNLPVSKMKNHFQMSDNSPNSSTFRSPTLHLNLSHFQQNSQFTSTQFQFNKSTSKDVLATPSVGTSTINLIPPISSIAGRDPLDVHNSKDKKGLANYQKQTKDIQKQDQTYGSLREAQSNERPLLDCYVNALLKKSMIDKQVKSQGIKSFTQKEFFATMRQNYEKKRFCSPKEEGKHYLQTARSDENNSKKQENDPKILRITQELKQCKQAFLHEQRMSKSNTNLRTKFSSTYNMD